MEPVVEAAICDAMRTKRRADGRCELARLDWVGPGKRDVR